MSSDIDGVENLLINLKVLGKLIDGSKLNTKEKLLHVDPYSWFQGLYRWNRGDNRKTTCEVIRFIIAKASKIVQISLQSSPEAFIEEKSLHLTHENLLKTLLVELKKTLKGLQVLVQTYEYDKTITSKLEVEIAILIRQNESIDEYFKKINS